MELIKSFIDFVLHVDVHLLELSREYGVWMYAILFLIVFCETGLVVTPFLPGDSLLFAVGSLTALGVLRVDLIITLLIAAALCGDNVNYWVGRLAGPKVFSREQSRLFNKAYLTRTQEFYARHGRKTVIIARFVPIVRTFAPFVAGIGRMTYRSFITFSIVGATLWVVVFVFTGYYFGNLPVVKQNFTLVIAAIVLISLIPGVVEFLRQRKNATEKV
jgi:membrane-associated protein